MADPARAHALKQELEQSMDAYKRLQADVTKAVNASSQLHSQEVENSGVLEELKRLDDDANVYKLIGPALIKQDLVEAKSNVSKRLEYIKGELERADGQIKALEGKQKEKETELMKLDKKMQAMGLANPGS